MMTEPRVESTAERAVRMKSNTAYNSSAIFLAFTGKDADTRISFLNSFLLKRNIPRLIAKLSARDLSGKLLVNEYIEVTEPKVYSRSMREMVGADFLGSVELEMTSVENLYIPNTASIALYQTKDNLCQLHSYARKYYQDEMDAGRVLNIGEEVSWTLRDDAKTNSFFAFHNGPQSYETDFKVELTNHAGEKANFSIPSRTIRPFETVFIKPTEHLQVAKFLNGKEGEGAVSFTCAGVFPRGLAGNVRVTENGEFADFQATHTNFNYRKISTPRLPKNDSGFVRMPFLPANVEAKEKLIFYGDFMDTNSVTVSGQCGESQVLPGRPTIAVTVPGDTLEVKSSDERGLPNRLVNAIAVGFNPHVLPSEISAGIITSGYKVENKHWYWGVAFSEKTSGWLTYTRWTNITPFNDKKESIQLAFYDEKGLCGEGEATITQLEKGALELRKFVNRETTGLVWFRCICDYTMVSFFNVLYDAERRVGSVEHPF